LSCRSEGRPGIPAPGRKKLPSGARVNPQNDFRFERCSCVVRREEFLRHMNSLRPTPEMVTYVRQADRQSAG
jgi:hypothetical protein